MFVSVAPQAYFVQQIGKDRVDVQVLVEPGADPHTYEPKPQQMVALSKARLYFAIGIEFEKAKLGKITAMNPNLTVVHTDHGILKLPMAAHHHHPDAADDDHAMPHTDKSGKAVSSEMHAEHDHGSRDPHIWLSPPLVMLQARSILTALETVDPDHRSGYEANYRAFMLELVDLDARLRADFDGLQGSSFMVFHPSWGTFAHAYGLRQVSIEIEGKSPKPAQLMALIEHARESGIKVVFVQPQFSLKSAREISKAIDGRVVVVDPLAGDWATQLRKTAEEIKRAFE
ncbi:metal ABC transporter solute-binding protein, Zn/Mn family [Desulfosarcina ovata]|uniref:Cation ABC transporter substrate-binding protein n=1 Tax=Desulfosarcina ovata subsp. ovata TaxID=2752305 RepID=A0A5K8ACR9_9BACT|nr:zinc ABC transporter substrate-binding protein [Desulfosarcina ovata]BBO90309.1 cation ABC transporter substrate-binding protein [Desulfosarcina ovata subsp. ovata]